VVQVNIPELWDYQEELVYAPERFIYVKGGRRSGKSHACMYRQGIFACQNGGSNNWTVDRTWRSAGVWFRWVRAYLLPKAAVLDYSISDHRIELINGATWEFRSADNPDTSLRGEGVHSLVGHEVAFWSPYARDTARAIVTDKSGWVAYNSTPRGLQNWFAQDWTLAFQASNTGKPYEATRRAFSWPTLSNPNISREDVEDARRTMPDAMFRQEYLGEFVSDAGSLFKINAKCWSGNFELPVERGIYVAGYDLAKRRDWTAWCILRIDVLPWRLVAFGRMQQIDFTSQAVFLEKKFKQYKIRRAHADMYQETVLEILQQKGIPVEGVTLSATSRPTILMNLAVPLERGEVRIPFNSLNRDEQKEIDVLRGQFENFTPNVSKLGSIRYEAAPGYNDDYVFAFAMAVEAAKQQVILGNRGAGSFVASSRGGVLK
jgi:hypothetical protein